jgi:hypothetical protein
MSAGSLLEVFAVLLALVDAWAFVLGLFVLLGLLLVFFRRRVAGLGLVVVLVVIRFVVVFFVPLMDVREL